MKKISKAEKILVTAALPYINNVPHLGHIVGSHLPADIFARYCRLKGRDVLFVGGSDENGTPSELAAREAGINVEKFCDKLHLEHKKIYDWFNISYDNFSRTSRKIHHKTTQEFFKEIYKNGYISEGKLQMLFCPECKIYLADRYVKGTCPKCGYENARGDQCEKCGSLLETKDLINPKCNICGSTPMLKESEHLFFRVDKLVSQLEKWLDTKKNLWRSQVLNWALAWIKEGIKPRCITRDIKHGVRVPLEGFKNKTFYVWFDAPIGYISATKEIAPRRWEEFWKNPSTKIYHFLGKDNIPFHTIFWPGMLMAYGGFNLPYQVVGLQYLNYEGGKFSKSQKRGIFCEKLPETKIDPDVVRAYLIFLIPETSDSEFRWDDFQKRINNDLIGNYANFVNRVLSFIDDKFNGYVVKLPDSKFSALDRRLIQVIKEKTEQIEKSLEKMEFRKAFNEILALSGEGNKYFDYNSPWKLIEQDKGRTNNVLYLCANLIRTLAILSSPFLPSASQKIWEQLNLQGEIYEKGTWDHASEIILLSGHKINKPYTLFEKLTTEYLENFRKTVMDIKDLKNYFS